MSLKTLARSWGEDVFKPMDTLCCDKSIVPDEYSGELNQHELWLTGSPSATSLMLIAYKNCLLLVNMYHS